MGGWVRRRGGGGAERAWILNPICSWRRVDKTEVEIRGFVLKDERDILSSECAGLGLSCIVP